MDQRCFLLLGVLTSSVGFVGCSGHLTAGETNLSSHVEDYLACKSFRSEVFNSFYKFVDEEKSLPSAAHIREFVLENLKHRNIPASKEILKKQLASEIGKLSELMTTDVTRALHPANFQEHLQKLIEMEFEATATPENVSLNQNLQKSIAQIDSLTQALELDCEAADPGNQAPTPLPGQSLLPLSLQGAHIAMATAYQSCVSLRLPAMVASTPPVEGIVKTTKVDSVGYRREYKDLSAIIKTHYYLQGGSYGGACRNILSAPMIYDYGGQPVVQSDKINFFQDSGGGSALGIDCSAFISSGLATAGLKYSSKVDNKPIFIRQTSRNFIDPKTSGWDCFERITLTPKISIANGDIMAISGHVLMVDDAGEDPFGIKNIASKKDCDALSHSHFNFSVLQSSPSKNSIGINKYIARDYLSESNGMRAAFLNYAKMACYAFVDQKNYANNDLSSGIIRHKNTPACKAPRVELTNESCITQCPELTN